MKMSLKLLVAIALLAPLGAMPVSAQVGRGQGLEIAIAAQERHTAALMTNPAVVGTAVGLNAGGQPAVIIFSETSVHGFPGTLDGVPVVVRQSGRIYALHHRPGHGGGPGGGGDDTEGTSEPSRTEKWPRPVPIGISTGHPDITAGTIGARVSKGTEFFALSNNHVYAAENQAQPGDNVLQPGPYDGGANPGDEIGTLEYFQPLQFCDPYPSNCPNNVIDAAIAASSSGELDKSTPSDGYGTPRSTTAQAYINQKLKKYGRTTGLTAGSVYAINATVNVQYGTGVARFVNQIVIQPGGFSAGGDSGSLVVVDGKGKDKADDNKPVGLLFAGSIFFTIANPIDAVLETFNVNIDGN